MPATTRVVQMEPGPTPTFTPSTPASISAWAPSRVATLPPTTSTDTTYVFGWGELPLATAKPRGGTTRGTPVTLWLLQPVSEVSGILTRPIVGQFILYGLAAVILSGLGAALVAQSVLKPLDLEAGLGEASPEPVVRRRQLRRPGEAADAAARVGPYARRGLEVSCQGRHGASGTSGTPR